MRHPYVRGILSVVVSVLLALPAFVDTRLAILVPAVGVTVVVACSSKWAVPSVVASALLAILLAFQPHGADLLWLELKYSDTFVYMGDGAYHSKYLNTAIDYSPVYGDNYYSILYTNEIERFVRLQFPHETEFSSIQIVPVQVKEIYLDWETFYTTVLPPVMVRAKVPERFYNWEPSMLPDNIHMEVIP